MTQPTPQPIRTRFAPSPTGYIHIGGIRTALYNWLYAQKHKGQFLLRIEDSDSLRSATHFDQEILTSLQWLGMTWDEKVIRQSERLDIYRQRLNFLIDNQHAYRCTCSKERLEKLRAEQIENKQKPAYDGTCRGKNIGADSALDYVVRLASPLTGQTHIRDTLRGQISIDNRELDDMILWRSNDTPTYQLCVVIDDIETKITHIIRGDDHLNNTARQAHIYHALDAPTPTYTHCPLIMDEATGKPLSKRSPSAHLTHYRQVGIIPEALLNYLLRLGWSHGDEEIFSPEKMIEFFSLEGLNRSATQLNLSKLSWLNQQHLRLCSPPRLRQLLEAHAVFQQQHALDPPTSEKVTHEMPTWIALATEPMLQISAQKASDLNELAQFTQSLALHKLVVNSASLPEETVQAIQTQFKHTTTWQPETLKADIKQLCQAQNLKMPQLAMALREMLLGQPSRLGISEILWALGQEQTLARIERWLAYKRED